MASTKTSLEGIRREGRATLTVTEAAQIVGISRGAMYRAVHAGEIPSLRLGRRLLIPVGKLSRMFEGEGASQ